MVLSNPESMEKALEVYKKDGKKKSIRAIASECGVSKSCLHRRINSQVKSKGKYDGRYLMSSDEENLLEAFVIYQILRSTPLTCKQIADIASRMTGTDSVSRPWVTSFLERARFLEPSNKSKHLDHYRLKNDGKGKIEFFFEVLNHYSNFFNVQNDHIWNTFETGFNYGESAKGCIYAGVEGTFHTESSDKTELISVLEMISKAGATGKPLFIFKGKRNMTKWTKEIMGNPVGIATSSSGYMNPKMFNEWIDFQFGSSTTAEKNEWSILIMDGQETYTTETMTNNLFQRRVIPIYFPPHTTDILQPLDGACFGVMKIPMTKINQIEVGLGIDPQKAQFIPNYMANREKKLSKQCILKGWERAGLLTNDPSIAQKEYDRQLKLLEEEYNETAEQDVEEPDLNNPQVLKKELGKLYDQGKEAMVNYIMEMKKEMKHSINVEKLKKNDLENRLKVVNSLNALRQSQINTEANRNKMLEESLKPQNESDEDR